MKKAGMKTRAMIALLAALVALASALAGCSLVKEGITGEKPDSVPEDEGGGAASAAPAAYPIIGDWFGVYAGSEYLSFRFTADGKCELQPALYPSDMFGPRYYGDYHWGGYDGREIILDMYQGTSREVDYGNGNVLDEWSDGGRDSANTALTMTFYVYGGTMKSFAVIADAAGIDTEGYLVVQAGAFLVLIADAVGGAGSQTPFIYGSEPYDETEGKTKTPAVPNAFFENVTRFYTTDELNVRCGPSTDFGTYGTVPKGTPVDRIGSMTGREEWAFVLLSDGGGWVNTGYLADAPPKTEEGGE